MDVTLDFVNQICRLSVVNLVLNCNLRKGTRTWILSSISLPMYCMHAASHNHKFKLTTCQHFLELYFFCTSIWYYY